MCGIFCSVEHCSNSCFSNSSECFSESSLHTKCQASADQEFEAANALAVRGPDHTKNDSKCRNGIRWTTSFHRLMVVNQSHDADQPIVHVADTTSKDNNINVATQSKIEIDQSKIETDQSKIETDQSKIETAQSKIKSYRLMCNGEIYNYKALSTEFKLNLSDTASDCEVILRLYLRLGIEKTLALIPREFAFVLIDETKHKIFVARDHVGVRPLYVGMSFCFNDAAQSPSIRRLAFSSELEPLVKLGYTSVKQFPPAHLGIYEYCESVESCNSCRNDNTTLSSNSCQSRSDHKNIKDRQLISTVTLKPYFNIEHFKPFPNTTTESERRLYESKIRDALTFAVTEMFDASRPIGSLLSGGVDSSLIAALLCRVAQERKCFDKLQFFSIGLEGSEDVFFAKEVAKALGIPRSQHHIVTFTVDEGIAAIPAVIKRLSSFDITTVRASTPQYLLAKYIATKTDVRVVFSGEGSDELLNSYKFSKNAPHAQALFEDSKRLYRELCYFDVLRTDRTMSGFGLEVRVPFLHPDVVRSIMTMPINMRLYEMIDIPVMSQTSDMITIQRCQLGKLALRRAFLRDQKGASYLPMFLLMRDKCALSDGVSSTKVSWYRTMQNTLESKITDLQLQEYVRVQQQQNETILHLIPKNKESFWYRQLYEQHYGTVTHIDQSPIPHFWMPKWQSETIMSLFDPSATVL